MSRRDDQIISFFLDAYRAGAFPMAEPPARGRGRWTVRWYRPHTRAVFELDPPRLHVSRSLRRTLRARRFRLTTDAAFSRVIRACAEPGPTRGLPWLSDELIACYDLLHEHGHAHSIEVWLATDADPPDAHRPPDPATLVGGIYGLHIGAAFFAESMFSRPALGGTDASKVALYHLVAHLRSNGFLLLDAQLANPHTESLGVREIPLPEYLARLEQALTLERSWLPFDPEESLISPGNREP